MRRSTLYALIAILALTAFAGYVDLPGTRSVLGRNVEAVEGLDLQGGLQVLLRARPGSAESLQRQGKSLNTAMEDARGIIENRVNALGVSEPLIQRQGADRIVVELPGIKDPERAIQTFKSTGLLEFVDAGDQPLPEGTLVNTTQGPATSAQATTAGTTPAADGTPETVKPAEGTPAAAGSTPAAGATPAPAGTAGQPPAAQGPTYRTVMTGTDIASATAGIQQQGGAPVVDFKLTSAGAKTFADFTSANVNKYLAIAVDKRIISSPQIQGAITGGQGQITGVTSREAQDLALQLRYGSLPVALDVESSTTVGATLGRDSIERSITAGLIGVLAVALFMILYYRLPGFISVLALAVYSLLTFAIFKLAPVVLTLAGIAGFVLSIGMAVDANVLIFARMKEELRRGRSLVQAVDAGFRNAWPSIRDSNISTLITCVILFWFGSQFGASVIRGFALTLAIGVLVSMFTAITVTRTFLRVVTALPVARNIWYWGIGRSEAGGAAARPATGPALGGTRPR